MCGGQYHAMCVRRSEQKQLNAFYGCPSCRPNDFQKPPDKVWKQKIVERKDEIESTESPKNPQAKKPRTKKSAPKKQREEDEKAMELEDVDMDDGKSEF